MNKLGRIVLCAALFLAKDSSCDAKKHGKEALFKTHCSHDEMRVELVKPVDAKAIYLERLKEYPDKTCHPVTEGDKVTFSIDLRDIYKCMVTKVVNKGTGRLVYYHRIIVEHEDHPKQVILVKCDSAANVTSSTSEIEELRISKRSAMPQFENFREDEEIEITGEVTGTAPVPDLLVEVRQNNIPVDNELSVTPGTPLEMNIALDSRSSDIYGVLVSSMAVSDMRQQEEILILNGCTVDPYLFQNFLTEDGDVLRAEFKAFKFPTTNYVLFKGNVIVCLDKCNGVECANGQTGYGRRRRRDVPTSSSGADPNRIFEVSMATIVKVTVEGEDVDVDVDVEEEKEVMDKIVDNKGKKAVWLEKATLSEVFHADEANVHALSEEFGGVGRRHKYTYFESDTPPGNGSARTALLLLLPPLLALLNLLNLLTRPALL